MPIEIAVILTIAGMSAFFGAGEYEARDGGANHRMLGQACRCLSPCSPFRWARA